MQTAHLAEQSDAGDAPVTACLLHDLGHKLNDPGRGLDSSPTLRDIDDVHQHVALPFLRGLFPDTVLGAKQLHVDAKSYVCQTAPGYHARLYDDSKRSLTLRGGVFGATQVKAFITLPGAHNAVPMRQWDDLAKPAALRTPPLAQFVSRAERCSLLA